jgi:hypothetical protein
MRGNEARLAATVALSAGELATIQIVACRSARRACLAGELVPGFLHGLAQRHVAGERVAGNADGARGDVDVDPVTPGSLLISDRTALAQWSQVIPVTAIWRVDTIVIVASGSAVSDAYATSASYRVW